AWLPSAIIRPRSAVKLLAATVLVAAFVPAMPSTPPSGAAARTSGPPARTSEPQVRAAPRAACARTPGRTPAHAHAPADARLRPGGTHARERNELTPGQAARVERQLDRILRSLGLGPAQGPTGERRSSGENLRTSLRLMQQITVPVHFHVLHDGPKGNVSDALIRRQIRTLNDSYG